MKNLLLTLCILLSTTIHAQYITLDEDGYTNVCKQPNAKSEIVEIIKKYQVFYPEKDIPCNLDGYGSNIYVNWLAITTDMINKAGYIYKKNFLP